MKLQEKIQRQLRESMKAKDEVKTSTLRVLVGELQRQPQKELNDSEVLSIIRKLIKSEVETLAKTGGEKSSYLIFLEEYMPRQADKTEIREWVMKNIDLSQFKNKMQAMKPIMAHFSGSADGSTVKRILEEL